MFEPIKDKATVDAKGNRLQQLIEGVVAQPLIVHADERGSLTELYHPAFEIPFSSIGCVTLVTIRPGRIKGWVKHLTSEDRVAVISGTAQVVLFDDRPDSPTYEMVNEIFLSTQNPKTVVIPIGVYHAVRNVGHETMTFVNMPTKAYDHASPDKYRLPLDNERIPFKWR
jgi:dTDP-4-dehydrorhamnose 3,5-epimerase